MKVFDFQCEKCEAVKLDFIMWDEPPKCECGEVMVRKPVATKEYHIRGKNDASVTPRKSKANL